VPGAMPLTHWIMLLLKLTLLLTATGLFVYYILIPAVFLIYLDQLIQVLAPLMLIFFGV
jgi:hypothetical protein